MKIKAVDIARELGISKATVSLALHDKPGVSERTKQQILECMEQLQEGTRKQGMTDEATRMIKVVIASRNLKIVCDSELDLWTDVLTVFEREAKKRNYTTSVTYYNIITDTSERLIEECNQSYIAGVIVNATELKAEDTKIFNAIDKPLVYYNYDSGDGKHHCILPDNYHGVERAMEYLYKRNLKNVQYLANDKTIYNFSSRREAFSDMLMKYNADLDRENIIPIGTTIDGVYHNMKKYLSKHNLPDAFIMENYQVSIGVVRALREAEIAIPQQISLIGIDEVPSYITGECKLTTIRIPHTERAPFAMLMLEKDIEDNPPDKTKSKIYTDCCLIEGNSVKQMP